MTPLLSILTQDLRFALRQLRRYPGFSLTVIVTLTLGIGAASALTAVLRSTLLSTLPYPHPSELVEITDVHLHGAPSAGLVGLPRSSDLASLLRDGRPVFSGVAAFYANDGQLAVAGQQPLSTTGAAVSGNFFATLAVPPALGRTLGPADDTPGSGTLVVLSDRLWRSAFAANSRVLGQTVRLGTDQATVVGVMPASFNLPTGTDLWYPGHFSAFHFGSYRGNGTRFVHVLARVAPLISLAAAQQSVRLLAHRLALAYPATDADWTFALTPLRSGLFGSLSRGLLLLSTAVALIFLVMLVNLAGLQLARNWQRSPEFTLRSALGVSRSRLLLQLFIESSLLIGIGCANGLALAFAALRLLRTSLAPSLFLVHPPRLDLATLALGISLALVTDLLLSGLALARNRRSHAIAQPTTTRSSRRFGRLFSAAQIALTLVLLTLSAATLTSLFHLLSIPLGFRTGHILTCSINLGWNVDTAQRHRFYQQVQAALAALPGVQSVGAISDLPLTSFNALGTFDVAGRPLTPNHDTITAEARSETPGFAQTLGIPLIAGRPFTPRDTDPGAPPVVAVNQAFARRFFPGTSPLGHRLLSPGLAVGAPLRSSEIVAIFADTHGTGGPLLASAIPEVYNPEDGGWPHMQFAVRSTLDPATVERQIRAVVTTLNNTASVSQVAELSSLVDAALSQPRWSAALLGALAALAVLLVVLGIYGLVALDTVRRSRELALRLALGATRGNVLGLLLGESGVLLSGGLLAGLLGSLATVRLLHALSADLPSSVPGLLFVPAVALLALAVFLATLLPARRATLTDPAQILRSE